MRAVTQQQKLKAIRAVLMAEWDPLGVGAEPHAQDEYDSYMPAVLGLLDRRASVAEVARFLGDVVRLDMGIPAVSARDEEVAARLSRLRESWD